MLALALGAVALVIASGAVRCSLATPEPSKENTQGQGQVESSGEAAREEPSAASFEEAGAQGGFADLKNTTWVSEDGKSALSIIEGALIESGEAGQSILYYSVESEQAQHDGLTATLAVSDSMTDDEELTVAVVQMSSEGRRTLTCDKLSCAYVLEEVQATAITVAEADERANDKLLVDLTSPQVKCDRVHGSHCLVVVAAPPHELAVDPPESLGVKRYERLSCR